MQRLTESHFARVSIDLALGMAIRLDGAKCLRMLGLRGSGTEYSDVLTCGRTGDIEWLLNGNDSRATHQSSPSSSAFPTILTMAQERRRSTPKRGAAFKFGSRSEISRRTTST